PSDLPATEIADDVQRQIDQWLEAMRWQRVANRALCFLSLTHTQFLVLLGAARALAGRKAAVSVADIADAAALDASTTSILITKLAATGHLDKDLDGLDARQVSVLVTREGYACLHRAAALLAAAAAELDELEPPLR